MAGAGGKLAGIGPFTSREELARPGAFVGRVAVGGVVDGLHACALHHGAQLVAAPVEQRPDKGDATLLAAGPDAGEAADASRSREAH